MVEEEQHAMDKPKKLEVQTEGDLSEIKKDPIWKTWFKEKTEESGKKQTESDKPKMPEVNVTPPPVPQVPEEDKEETYYDNVKQVTGAETGEAILGLVGLGKGWKTWLDKAKKKKKKYPEHPSSENSYQTHIDKPIHWRALREVGERKRKKEEEENEDVSKAKVRLGDISSMQKVPNRKLRNDIAFKHVRLA